ncbi:efflux RND transporter permease subunit [Candidatus Palauibacter sp.]|uniref:efflux RND transporter permease subunit n=1 Tax=Candidatus Palauibacter sp. TaxID=3101350 RepID=UPI003AF1F7D2
MRALGLTLTDIANTIRRSSLDLSAGSIDTRESQARVRTLGQNYNQQDFEEIVLLGNRDGTGCAWVISPKCAMPIRRPT